MPRRRIGLAEQQCRTDKSLVERLAHELRNGRDSGQPLIYEQVFPTEQLKVSVIWDDWDHLSLEERTETVLRAYEQAEGRDYRDRIALASGLTVPEACAAGMLPCQLITALRKGDPVTLDECRKAMIEEGASTLLSPDRPQLRFASLDEAEASRKRLIQRLPGSDPVWIISQDVGSVEDWAQR